MAPTVRDLLNRLRWDGAVGTADVVVEVRERVDGAEAVRAIAFGHIAEILSGGVEQGDGTFIPYHRVLAVRQGARAMWPPRRGEE